MASKAAFAVLLVVCLAELSWASPAPLYTRRSTNDTAPDDDTSSSPEDTSSSNTTSSSNGSSSDNVFDEIKENVDGFFGHLFGKRAVELATPDVFTKLYEEWAKGRSDRSVTVRDSDSGSFAEIFEKWLKENWPKRSVSVRDNGFNWISDLTQEWPKGDSNKRSVTVRDNGFNWISDLTQEWPKGDSNKRSVTV